MADDPHVGVVGEGAVVGFPDGCVVNAVINVLANTVADAVTNLALLTLKATEWLREAGIESSEIRTTSLRVQDWIDRATQTVTARVASYQLEITVRQLEKLSDYLAGLVSIAGDSLQVQGLQLTLSDPVSLRREARDQAMRDARQRAEQLAQLAGGSLGRVVSVDEGDNVGFRSYRRAVVFAASAGPAPSVPIEPGSMTVICRVAVTYELRDGNSGDGSL